MRSAPMIIRALPRAEAGRGTERPLRRAGGGWDLQGRRDLLHLVALDDVAFLDVVVAVEADAALVPGRDLADVVLEAAQRSDAALPDLHRIAHQADLRVADDLALGDVAAGDDADLRDAEGLA